MTNDWKVKGILLSAVCFISAPQLKSQYRDSSQFDSIKQVDIREFYKDNDRDRMPDVLGNTIYAGKKTEVIRMNKLDADIMSNNTRQVFAKVPGINIWENDGSGIQVGVATRGLSPNRSWEFNVRQNGYDISAESFGYPESYYSPPMEAVERIEVVRGAASLQFGPQFGGLLQYQIKKGNPNKKIAIESQQTLGSYGLFNSYNAVGGKLKKWSYYAFYHRRSANGWRKNSEYQMNTGYFSIAYQITKKMQISAEYTHMDYKSQQPGGLTDVDFKEYHQNSVRARNWFGAPWNVGSISYIYDIRPNISFQVKAFTTIAQRNSVGFMKAIHIPDTIHSSTLQYGPRQVDRDNYKNFGAEGRFTVKYQLLGNVSILAAGVRAYQGNTNRKQNGVGSTGNDFSLTITEAGFAKSLHFGTTNYALFAENIFYLGKRIKIVPGIRYDYIGNTMDGFINNTPAGKITSQDRNRNILLYGMGAEFTISNKIQCYSNYSLAFRPVTFSELTPSATTETVDPKLKDANGYNFDFGMRGDFQNIITFDIGVFYLMYNNRIGVISQNGTPFKSNIGTSTSKGIESFIELDVMRLFTQKTKIGNVKIFSSNSITEARYTKWNNPDVTKSIEGKKVENAPAYIHRFGVTYQIGGFSASLQKSFTAEVFTDAANTETPNASGTVGKLPAYSVLDLNMSYRLNETYMLRAGVNNAEDTKYATRRSGGYPGPGLLPGNGRTFYLSLGISL